MSPILGVIASSISGSKAVTNSYESIATANGTGSSGSISFTSIPSGYAHLQIRGILRSDASGTGGIFPNMRLNSDSANSYSRHNMGAYASTTASTDSNAGSSLSSIVATAIAPKASDLTNAYGAVVIDLLDYGSVNKYKTTRYLMGLDINGNAYSYLYFGSGLWQSTSAVSAIEIYLSSGSFTTATKLALYGIKS